MRCNNDKIIQFVGFEEPDKILFPSDGLSVKIDFSPIWQDIRLNDDKLEKPTHNEIVLKIRKHKQNYKCKKNKFSKKLLHRINLAAILSLENYKGFLMGIKVKQPNSIMIELELEDGVQPVTAICDKIGIAELNTKEFLQILNIDINIYFILKTEKMSPKYFLNLLYWIADIYEMKLSNKSIFLILRNRAELEQEQEQIWERLPDNIDKILCRYKKSQSYNLIDYLWY